MNRDQLTLDILRKGCSGIIESFGSYMCDCAVFCLASQGHSSGAILKLQIAKDHHVEWTVVWNIQTDSNTKYSMNDEERTTDFGAMCMAILFVLNLTEYKHFVVSKKGTGVDFWLYTEYQDDLNLAKADARLEVSGIRKESDTNKLAYRLKIKLKQAQMSSYTGKVAYIALTEFSKPESIFIRDGRN